MRWCQRANRHDCRRADELSRRVNLAAFVLEFLRLLLQARIHRRLGRRDLAIEYCERAIEINPHQVQALITLARLYLETDRQDDARTRLQQVLDLGHEYADVYFYLGCIHRDRGQRDQAKTSYHKALQINGGYKAARDALEALAA